ncbi:COMM domain-containing protein 8-like [Penaeus monodon]|uniref:COMM domain-containing protein 8-like n=1 Tax=Penaeus monodon TaxID=6687 RepID=UPI0018A7841E|nr:COMM domain-containing protein 8-like [Penaeus monodon]
MGYTGVKHGYHNFLCTFKKNVAVFLVVLQQVKITPGETVIALVSIILLLMFQILEILRPLGQEMAEKFLSAVSVREDEIKKALIQESLKDTVYLKDFDWNVRLAVASDKVLDLNESIMTLHLHTSNTDKGNNTLTVEMLPDQVDRLIEQLKGAREKLAHTSNSR